jgi:hypothetical protein
VGSSFDKGDEILDNIYIIIYLIVFLDKEGKINFINPSF